MSYGYNDRVAHVDLTSGLIREESPGETFFQTFMGGSAVGAYYLLKKMPPGVDPLGPDNVVVFAPSVVTGAPISGLSRFNITAKSPLTGGIGDAQCGGHWGPQLKYAGFDAVVVTGRSDTPVYLWIADGKIQIREAAHLVHLFPKELEAAIKNELSDERLQVLQNGPAGRRLVRFANAGNSLHHFAGRTGMGAVMGAKNLVALAVRGQRSYSFFDEQKVKELARMVTKRFQDHSGFARVLSRRGTAAVVESMQGAGGLPTLNMSSGVFEHSGGIDSEAMHRTIFKKSDTCLGCVVRCKKVVACEEPYSVDEAYGGPEYETIAMLGSNVGIGDIRAVAKANELCNAYGLDTISTGAMIAFAIECYENGIISNAITGGLELTFGNTAAILETIKLIGERRGIGDILAEGFAGAVKAFGPGSEQFAMHVKGNAIPAHMPQIKKTQALAYAVNAFGADHMSSEHDGMLEACPPECVALGITEARPYEVLDAEKVRYVAYTQMYYSVLDTLELCAFCFAPGGLLGYRDLEDIVQAVTGFPGNLWYLMKVGERRLNMLKAFNYREGIGPELDQLPQRIFAGLPDGPSKGVAVDPVQLEKSIRDYYAIMGWDYDSGRPSRGKLLELGLSWLEGELSHVSDALRPNPVGGGGADHISTQRSR